MRTIQGVPQASTFAASRQRCLLAQLVECETAAVAMPQRLRRVVSHVVISPCGVGRSGRFAERGAYARLGCRTYAYATARHTFAVLLWCYYCDDCGCPPWRLKVA